MRRAGSKLVTPESIEALVADESSCGNVKISHYNVCYTIMQPYAHPDVLVETEWVAQHLNDGSVRIAEVDYDPVSNYNQGHIPGAVLFDWKKDMNDQVARDILSKQQLDDVL